MDTPPHRQGPKPVAIRRLHRGNSEAGDPKMIFFDAAGTLIHLPRGVGFHYAEVAAHHGWECDAQTLGRAFRFIWKGLGERAATEGPRPDDDRASWRELVDRVLVECDAPRSFDRAAYFNELYDEFIKPGVWALYPEVIDVLDLLTPHYRLGGLSNFDGRLRPILAQLGILDRFAVIVISSEVGADKPDPVLFTRATVLAGIAPDEALLVGDDPEHDIAGAQRAGWRAFHVERPQITLRDLPSALNELHCDS